MRYRNTQIYHILALFDYIIAKAISKLKNRGTKVYIHAFIKKKFFLIIIFHQYKEFQFMQKLFVAYTIKSFSYINLNNICMAPCILNRAPCMQTFQNLQIYRPTMQETMLMRAHKIMLQKISRNLADYEIFHDLTTNRDE